MRCRSALAAGTFLGIVGCSGADRLQFQADLPPNIDLIALVSMDGVGQPNGLLSDLTLGPSEFVLRPEELPDKFGLLGFESVALQEAIGFLPRRLRLARPEDPVIPKPAWFGVTSGDRFSPQELEPRFELTSPEMPSCPVAKLGPTTTSCGVCQVEVARKGCLLKVDPQECGSGTLEFRLNPEGVVTRAEGTDPMLPCQPATGDGVVAAATCRPGVDACRFDIYQEGFNGGFIAEPVAWALPSGSTVTGIVPREEDVVVATCGEEIANLHVFQRATGAVRSSTVPCGELLGRGPTGLYYLVDGTLEVLSDAGQSLATQALSEAGIAQPVTVLRTEGSSLLVSVSAKLLETTRFLKLDPSTLSVQLDVVLENARSVGFAVVEDEIWVADDLGNTLNIHGAELLEERERLRVETDVQNSLFGSLEPHPLGDGVYIPSYGSMFWVDAHKTVRQRWAVGATFGAAARMVRFPGTEFLIVTYLVGMNNIDIGAFDAALDRVLPAFFSAPGEARPVVADPIASQVWTQTSPLRVIRRE